MSKTSIDTIDLKAVFNQDISKMIDKDEVNSSDFYNPAQLMKKDKKTSYSATIKFIPWLKNIPESRIQKWQIFLQNADKSMTKRLDCATTLGDKQPSILKDIYFALDGSSSAHEKRLAKNFGRKKQIFTLVQIIDDKQHPELVGQIKIWNFGVKVNDKIKLLMKPDADSGEESNNPYDIVNGRLFALKIQNTTTDNGVMPNYDNSYFLTDRKGGFLFGNKDDVASKNPKDAEMRRIATHILENQPDLEQCAYHRWEDDEELAQYVYDVIMEIIPRDGIFDKINKSFPTFFNSFTSQEIPKAKKPSKTPQIIHEEIDGDDEDEDEDESEIPVVKTKIKPIPVKLKKVIVEDDDDEDDEEDEDDNPIPTFNKVKTITKKVVVEEDDEDDDEEIPPITSKAKKQNEMINNVKKVNSKKVVEEDDEDEDEDEDDPVDLFIKKKKSQSKFVADDKFFE